MIRIVETPIDVAALLAEVARDSAGAIDLFVGVVRDHNEGRAVTAIDYHAYPEMAESEMRAIAEEVSGRHPIEAIGLVHRIGHLKVGEASVAVAASAVHRAEAFAACRDAIERIKRRVPIWKKERGPDIPADAGWVRACSDHDACADLPDDASSP